jgi:hypothetical protein
MAGGCLGLSQLSHSQFLSIADLPAGQIFYYRGPFDTSRSPERGFGWGADSAGARIRLERRFRLSFFLFSEEVNIIF